MEICTPCERVGKPLIGSNHMHSMVCREGDETSMLVECNCQWILAATIERWDVMALVSEWLQPIVGDDDSALVIDAYSFRIVELAWLIAFLAELEQERAVDRRQYLHSMILGITDDDSMSIMIDSNAWWTTELARLGSLVADREQEREIDRRQEHQSVVPGINDDDATMMLVDRNAMRIQELEISWSTMADARQERLLAQWQ